MARNGSWDTLFTTFTERVNPTVRMAVLTRLADPSVTIVTDNWDGCLFAVAVAAAQGKRSVAASVDITIRVLGLRREEVNTGYKTWDNATENDRSAFRDRIRAFLVEEVKRTQVRATGIAAHVVNANAAIQTAGTPAHV